MSSSVETVDLAPPAADGDSLRCCAGIKAGQFAWLGTPGPRVEKHCVVHSAHQMGCEMLIVVLELVARPVCLHDSADRKDYLTLPNRFRLGSSRYLGSWILTAYQP